MLDLGIFGVIIGLGIFVYGVYMAYNSWERYNRGFKSAEKMAPIFVNAGLAVVGLMLAFWSIPIWLLVTAVVLLGLGLLLRGPVSNSNR